MIKLSTSRQSDSFGIVSVRDFKDILILFFALSQLILGNDSPIRNNMTSLAERIKGSLILGIVFGLFSQNFEDFFESHILFISDRRALEVLRTRLVT